MYIRQKVCQSYGTYVVDLTSRRESQNIIFRINLYVHYAVGFIILAIYAHLSNNTVCYQINMSPAVLTPLYACLINQLAKCVGK